jgi:Glycosyl hydrolases family 28/Secretion system C-terminal sorting domain
MRAISLANPRFGTFVLTALCTFMLPAMARSTAKNGRMFVASTSDFVGDGKTDNTQQIQAAIDSCNAAGGGTVEFTAGTFLTGPITLESNVTLELDSAATLLGTTYMKAYYPAGYDTNLSAPSSLQPLITSNKASNITISGKGTIDGNGQPWWTAYNAAKASGGTLPARPRLIQLNHSQHITIDSVTLQNSPQFHVSLEYCWYVQVSDVTILAPSNSPNTDGIDPATCHFVYISHCRIDNGDDDIAVKSGKYDPTDPNAGCSNIWISDCTFLHGHGVSIGSETSGGVDSMYVDSCTFNGTDNGLRIKSYRGNGGNVRDISYSNISMQNVSNPIWISGYYPSIPSDSDPAQTVTTTTPDYHNISVINMTSTGSPTAGVIVGLPELPITNFLLRNVSISSNTGLEVRNAAIDTERTVLNVNSGPDFIIQNNGTLTGLKPVNQGSFPVGFELEQNYPNPFNPATVIGYSVPRFAHVTLIVFDVLGREAATLVDRNEPAGEYHVQFDGSRLASGVYYYRLNAGGLTETKKLMLVK